MAHLLGEAVDGGKLLREDLWHPLMVPSFHPPWDVRDIERRLSPAWKHLLAEQPALEADLWYGTEIGGVVNLFAQAASRNEAVVRFLEPPEDEERARRVVIPVARTG